jgi:hypothetical protein
MDETRDWTILESIDLDTLSFGCDIVTVGVVSVFSSWTVEIKLGTAKRRRDP